MTSAGQEANGASTGPSISGDGGLVAFTTEASNLAGGDANGRDDAYVHDVATGVTERASLAADGREPTGHSENVFVGAGGRFVAFANYSPLVPEDVNGTRDIFVLDRGPAVGIGGVSAARAGGEAHVSGWATFSGTSLSRAEDPEGDAGPGGAAGADFTGAEVVARPEAEDLLVRMTVPGLPSVRPPRATGLAIGCALLAACAAGVSGVPGMTYALALEVDGRRYEVRVERGASPAAPAARLLRCEAACTPVADLTGSVGVTGAEVMAAVPLSALDATPGAPVTGLRAWAGPGHPLGGPGAALDEASLPDGSIPEPTVSLGFLPKPAGAASTPAGVEAGWFSGRAAIPATAESVTITACLGEHCGSATVPVPG